MESNNMQSSFQDLSKAFGCKAQTQNPLGTAVAHSQGLFGLSLKRNKAKPFKCA